MVMYAWRTYTGEIKKNPINIYRKKIPHARGNYATLQWYRCGDPGLDKELVLCYNIESTNDKNCTNLKFNDRRLQTLTSSGKVCSGKVTTWHSTAKPGTYTYEGTII